MDTGRCRFRTDRPDQSRARRVCHERDVRELPRCRAAWRRSDDAQYPERSEPELCWFLQLDAYAAQYARRYRELVDYSEPTGWTERYGRPAKLCVFGDGFDGTTLPPLPDLQTLTITATPTSPLSEVTYADIVLHEANGAAPDAHIYVAVQGSPYLRGKSHPYRMH